MQPTQIGGDIGPQPALHFVIDSFGARPRLTQHIESWSGHRRRELLNRRQHRERFFSASGGCDPYEATIAAAFANDGPFGRIEIAVTDAGELQKRKMSSELADKRQPIARAEVLERCERSGIEVDFARQCFLPRQRRMPQNRNDRAVPAKAGNTDNNRAAGCSAHAHDSKEFQ